jgi:hypothetical protein
MSLTNLAEQAALDLIFINNNWAYIGDTTGIRGSTASGNLYISLHTADPGEAGGQTTSETSYTSYARVPVERSSNGWTRSGATISNAIKITFPQCTGSTATVTHFGIGTESTGAGNLLMKGNLTLALAVSTGITPDFVAGALTATLE